MVRLGLLTAGGTLIAKPGLSAITTTKDGSLNTDSRTLNSVDYTPPSPKARPWIQPMPIIPLKASVQPDQIQGGMPDGYTVIQGATERVPHQLFTFDRENKTYGGQFPPKKFYEMTMKEAKVQIVARLRVHHDLGLRRRLPRAAHPGLLWDSRPGPISQSPALGHRAAGVRHLRDRHPSAQCPYGERKRRLPE